MIFGIKKVEKQISFMKNFNYKISHTSYEIVDKNKIKSLEKQKIFIVIKIF